MCAMPSHCPHFPSHASPSRVPVAVAGCGLRPEEEDESHDETGRRHRATGGRVTCNRGEQGRGAAGGRGSRGERQQGGGYGRSEQTV